MFRAVLAACRLAPGDRVLLAGPAAGALEPTFEALGLRVSCEPRPDAAQVAKLTRAAGAVAFEAAVWCGTDMASGRTDPLTPLRPLVRPGRYAVSLRRCGDVSNPAGVPGGVRFADRGRFGFPSGAGGWVMQTAPGAAAPPARLAPVRDSLAAAA